jgi:hypothetical protein
MNIGYICNLTIEGWTPSITDQFEWLKSKGCEKIYMELDVNDDSINEIQLKACGIERCTIKEIPQTSKDVLFIYC